MRWFATLCFASIVLGSSFLGSSAFAQQAPAGPSLFERLPGRWVARGEIDGQPTVHDVDADFVLNREYVRLHEVSREKDAAGAPAYEAIVLIGRDKPTGDYLCLWLDNTSGAGLSAPIAHGKASGDSIAFVLNPGTDHVFHTTFVYDPAKDAWKWVLDGESKGTLQPFARLALTRREAEPGR